MQLFSWLRKQLIGRPSTRRPSVRTPNPRLQPRLEALERRDVPSFAAPVAYSSPEAVAMVTGDVSGDGKPDLITAVYGGNNVFVQLNTGKGTFAAPIGYNAGGPLGATALAVGPYLGKPSIWVAQDQTADGANIVSFRILQLNKVKGNETLTGVGAWSPTSGGVAGPISSLAVADLDGNGTTDLVAVPANGWDVYVQRYNSSGVFGPVQSYPIAPFTNPSSGQAQVAVGDLNGDGRSDLVVSAPQLNAVSVLLNSGNGTFGTAQRYAVGGAPTAVAVGDVSGDGKLDLVTANANGTVTVLLGQGNGTFGTAQNYATSGGANSVVLGDFNHDGHLDIATTGSTETDVLLNTGNGTLAAYQKVGPAGSALVAADCNGDGYLDLAEIDVSKYSIDVLLNNAAW